MEDLLPPENVELQFCKPPSESFLVNHTEFAIEVNDVSHAFLNSTSGESLIALESTTLKFQKGELISLIGPSGCGKSTLLNMIGGLLTPKFGSIKVNGVQVQKPLPQSIAFVFQENSLFPWNTILDNLVVALAFQNVNRREGLERANQALSDVGLSKFKDFYPDQLSGGMRQRAALARALCMQTEIILMDEPFAALDEQTRMVLGEDLSVLLAKNGKTIVLVTHSLGEAVFLSDRIAVFSARPGKIIKTLDVNEPHPRGEKFVLTEKFSALRNELYSLLHDEIRKTLGASMDAMHSDQRRVL
jgi:NitT/TauT family transport system ATP-binding protein